jgi:hypothetical protein
MGQINNLFVWIVATIGLALAPAVLMAPAEASPLQYAGVCPSTVGHVSAGTAGGLVGNAPDCNLLIVFNADGSVTISGPGGAYESVEDALIGVVNNSGHTITSFGLTNPGVRIFGFDGDGIDVYVLPPTGSIPPNMNDTSYLRPQCQNFSAPFFDCDLAAYGGPLVWFTNINPTLDTGTVEIIGGLASALGDINCPQFTPNSNPGTCNATYFSLEEPASLIAPPIVITPEPASTGLVLGAALAVFGALRRRNRDDLRAVGARPRD